MTFLLRPTKPSDMVLRLINPTGMITYRIVLPVTLVSDQVTFDIQFLEIFPENQQALEIAASLRGTMRTLDGFELGQVFQAWSELLADYYHFPQHP